MACEVVHCPIHHTEGALQGSPPPHEDDSCRAQGREPHAFSKQVANESQGSLASLAVHLKVC